MIKSATAIEREHCERSCTIVYMGEESNKALIKSVTYWSPIGQERLFSNVLLLQMCDA